MGNERQSVFELGDWRSLVEGVGVALFLHDGDTGDVLWGNQVAAEMYGLPQEELVGVPLEALSANTPPYTLEDASAWLQKARSEGPQTFDWHARRWDGHLFWVEVTLREAEVHGRPLLIATVRDITARRLADTTRRESEERFQSAFQDAAIGMALCDLEGRFLQANRALCETLGYSREELLGVSYRELTHPDDVGDSVQALQRLIAGPATTYRIDKRYLAKDGRVVWALVTVSLVRDHEGEPLHLICQVQDITQRVNAEDSLRESEQRYRTLVETMTDGLGAADATGTMTYANRRLCEMLRRSPDEVVGRHITEFLDDANREIVLAQIERRKQGIEEQYELAWRTGDGGEVLTLVSPTALRDDHGVYAGSFAVVCDITERRQMELERRELERGLQRAQALEAVGRLAGGVAHDFNNLMGSIMGCIYAARTNLEDQGSVGEELDRIQGVCRRGGELTRQLLAVAGRHPKRVEAVELGPLLEDTRALLERTLPRSIAVATRTAPGLPRVRADRSVLATCLLNLALNARDAMPGGGKLEITAAAVGAKGGQRRVALRVRDSGTGIPEGIRQKIFEPFFTTKPVGQGTGLGLATVRTAVAGWGGELTVRSAPGQGSTFTVLLAAAAPSEVGRGRPEGSAGHPLTDRPVLLVEDEDDMARALTLFLEGAGYTVHRETSGLDALELLRREGETFGLVVLDLILPGIGGEKVYRLLDSFLPGIPVLLISGREDLARELELDGPLLAKPFTRKALLGRLAELWAAHGTGARWEAAGEGRG